MFEVWTSDDPPENDFVDNELDTTDNEGTSPAISMFVHLLFSWKMVFNISDKCLDVLLHLIVFFLKTVQLIVNSADLQSFIDNFPGTIYKSKRAIGIDQDDFIKYVCCPQCNSIYKYQNAVYTDKDNIMRSKSCSFIPFPNHPQERFRSPCGAIMMKSVCSIDGKSNYLYPLKVYTYQKLKISLERLINRPDILDNLKKKINNTDGAYMSDIYHGSLWKELLDCENNLFFRDSRNLGGMMNVDWFQPLTNSEHSIGVIYMVLLNLSRDIRFKRENVIIVGIIPGPREPELHINSFLSPFVDELLLFWRGVYLRENGNNMLYRFALITSSSDFLLIISSMQK